MVRLTHLASVIGTVLASAPALIRLALLPQVASEVVDVNGGTALIDVSNPFVWARWNGDEEHKRARPEEGYDYDLGELPRCRFAAGSPDT